MPAKVISVINYKGGVGKTVSTYNIGVGLNYLGEKKVLLIDLDPQCSLSTICLKSLSKKLGKTITVADLRPEQTINSVLKDYLSCNLSNPHIDLSKLIIKDFYVDHRWKPVDGIDLIAATMFDNTSTTYEKGLDDLEIDITRQFGQSISNLDLETIFARFFIDTNIVNEYDYIIFDCPPANNIITQNALVVSDYYLIPTIMDDLSSNGIRHLKSLIENSIFGEIYNNNKRIIDNCATRSPYEYLKIQPKLLGIFETMRKTQATINDSRKEVETQFPNLVYTNIIYHHKDTAITVSNGWSCYSVNVEAARVKYTPHSTYGMLTLAILNQMGTTITKTMTDKIYKYL